MWTLVFLLGSLPKNALQDNSLIIFAQLSGFVRKRLFGRNHTLDKSHVNDFRIFVQFLTCMVVLMRCHFGRRGKRLKENLPK